MVLTDYSHKVMNNNSNNKNLKKFGIEGLDWSSVQSEMKIKLGMEVYESWLKKINFLDEFNNYILLSVPNFTTGQTA